MTIWIRTSDTESEPCPYCGGESFVTGKQDGYSAVMPQKGFSLKSTGIYHVICSKCGTVVRSYVSHPERLARK